MNVQQITLMVAEALREIMLRQGNVPFYKGDLRKAHVVEPYGMHGAMVSANTPYARAVHDGRGPITIKPKRKKALVWSASNGDRMAAKSVKQPAREGNPWMVRAVEDLEREGVDFLAPHIGQSVADDLSAALRKSGLNARQT